MLKILFCKEKKKNDLFTRALFSLLYYIKKGVPSAKAPTQTGGGGRIPTQPYPCKILRNSAERLVCTRTGDASRRCYDFTTSAQSRSQGLLITSNRCKYA